MPRITRVTTRRGDRGSTDLATGTQIPKDSPRIQAMGAVDELNSAIGVALAFSPQPETAEPLRRIQNDLFNFGAALSRPGTTPKNTCPTIERRHIHFLEHEIQLLQEKLDPLDNFLLPGGRPSAAALHLARAICRRAERDVIALSRKEPIESDLLIYLNRLSDLLFLLARWENKTAGVSEGLWDSHT